MSQADGVIHVQVMKSADDPDPRIILYSEKAACVHCGISYPEFTPAAFSFNSPQGACPECDGLGTVSEFDPDAIIPDPGFSLRDGAVSLWANRNSIYFAEFLDAFTSHYNVDIYTPYEDLPESFKQVLLYGSGDERIPFYTDRGKRRHKFSKTFEGPHSRPETPVCGNQFLLFPGGNPAVHDLQALPGVRGRQAQSRQPRREGGGPGHP